MDRDVAEWARVQIKEGILGEGSWMNMTMSNGLGNMTIGQSINWLFNHRSLFKFNYYEYPENKTIIWIITAPNGIAANILTNHIKQKECVIENGGTPRPNDPVFQVDAIITREYVNTTIIRINETVLKVVKVAENDCAYEVIKLHANIVKGFFTIGREEAVRTPKFHLKSNQYASHTCRLSSRYSILLVYVITE